jgi:20S proteasome subunit alpha 7
MYRAREEAAQYEEQFGIRIPGKQLADRIAQQLQSKTIYNAFRPYGSSIIFATHDILTPFALWMCEPSGSCFQYYGCASGRGKQICRNEIERGNFTSMTCEEALPKFVKILLKA